MLMTFLRTRGRVLWALFAVAVSVLPVAGGLSLTRVFHNRDLVVFWGRYLWLRRTLWSGESLLWDPYVNGGQAVFTDAMHQMFLLPALAIRLLGTEVLGFNLWVAVPFPLAALGAWLFFARRFSASSSTLGALAFTLSGPVISTGNMPNLSWSVAAIPWVLWATDRYLGVPTPRRIALLAFVLSCQVLTGEPITMTATVVLAVGMALLVGTPGVDTDWRVRTRASAVVAVGLALGLMAAAIQLVPLAWAVEGSARSQTGVFGKNFWALHPLALAETVSIHLFGDASAHSTAGTHYPWMTALNSGREPFFYSLYLGPALLSLAVFGAVLGWRQRWSIFWIGVIALSLLLAFGAYTPVYPTLQKWLPVLKSFRYPVKYLVFASMGVAALAAFAWEAMSVPLGRTDGGASWKCARWTTIAVPASLAAAAYLLSAGAQYFRLLVAGGYQWAASVVGVSDPAAATVYLMFEVPGAANRLMVLACAAAFLVGVCTSRKREARLAAIVLYAFVIADVTVQSFGIHTTLDAKGFIQPSWMSGVMADPHSRFYFGGKVPGGFEPKDLDASKEWRPPGDFTDTGQRDACMAQMAWYPSGWRLREAFSEDLSVVWPNWTLAVHQRFIRGDRQQRDRLLDRTGVRFRVLPERQAGKRVPICRVDYAGDLRLYDWGESVSRVKVLPKAVVMSGYQQQYETLFSESFPAQDTVLLERWLAPAGSPDAPTPAAARFVTDTPTRVVVEAGAGEGGGYLVLFDSYSPAWSATVDGVAAEIGQANGVFRAVHLNPGTHTVDFRYHPPPAFFAGAAVSALTLVVLGFMAFRRPRSAAPLAAASRG